MPAKSYMQAITYELYAQRTEHTNGLPGWGSFQKKPNKTSHFSLHFLFWGCFKTNCISSLSPLRVCSTTLSVFNEFSSGGKFCPGTGTLRTQKKVVCHFKGKRAGQLTSAEALLLYIQKEMRSKELLLAFLRPVFQLPNNV